MKRHGQSGRRTPKRKRSPLRDGVLIVGLVAATFLLADNSRLDPG
jgi:hypothetical protein